MSISNTKQINAPSGVHAWTLQVEFTETETSAANNTSTISLSCYLQSGGGSFSSGTNNTLVLVWHDNNENTDKVISILNVKAIGTNGRASTSGTYTATHKADGTLSGYSKVVWTKNDGNNYTPASATLFAASSDETGSTPLYSPLTNLAQASVPTLSKTSFPLGEPITINTNRKSSSYTHTIRIKHSSINQLLVTKTSAASYSMSQQQATDFESAVLALASTARAYTVIFEVETFSGNTSLGKKTVNGTATLTAAGHGPTYSNGSVTPADIVKDQTTATISVTVTPATGATISEVTCTNGDQTVQMALSNGVYSCTMSNLTSKDFKVLGTDSRGVKKSTIISADSYSEYTYRAPTIRSASYSNSVLSFSGVWTSTNNSITAKNYRVNGGSWTNIADFTAGTDIFSGSISLITDSNQDYLVEIQLTDSQGTTTYSYQIKSDLPLFWLGKETARCGKHWIFEGDGQNGEIEIYPSASGGIRWGNTIITKTIFDNLPSGGGGGGGGITTEVDPTVYSWAKQPTKPTYTASEVGALPASTVIPSKTSDLTNDSGYITSYTETDPTVPAWAKASTKPSYSASEVGALPASTPVPVVSIDGDDIKIVYNGSSHWVVNSQTYDQDMQAVDAAIAEKISIPSGGSAGNYLKKTSSGVTWDGVPSGADEIEWTGSSTLGQQTAPLNVEAAIMAVFNSIVPLPEKVTVSGSSVTQALDADKMYIFGTVSSLTITLNSVSDSSHVHEYHFRFTSGSTATNLTLPQSVVMPSGFTVAANKVYEISIVDNYGVYMEW